MKLQRRPNQLFNNKKSFIDRFMNLLYERTIFAKIFMKKIIINDKKNRKIYNLIGKKYKIRHPKLSYEYDFLKWCSNFTECHSAELTRPGNINKLQIHWIVPDFPTFSGGHVTILRIIKYMEDLGHNNTIWINLKCMRDIHNMNTHVSQNYFPIKAEFKILNDRSTPSEISGDILIVTDRWTAYPGRSVRKVWKKIYLVQDYEPYFYPMGTEYIYAEKTYTFNYEIITLDIWLKELLKIKFNKYCEYFPLGIEYNPNASKRKKEYNKKIIAYYCRSNTPRRGLDLALLTFEKLYEIDKNIEVIFFGEAADDLEVPYSFKSLGTLKSDELTELYNTVDCVLSFSFTNPSLLPREAAACNTPVVDIKRANTEAVFNNPFIHLVEPSPDKLAQKIYEVCHRPKTPMPLEQDDSRYLWNNILPLIADKILS